MKLRLKEHFIGYFNFYYNVLGLKLVLYLFLNILVALLDGLGLAMLIPLLQYSTQDAGSAGGGYNIIFFEQVMSYLGLTINLQTILFFLILVFVVKGIIKYAQMLYQAYIKFLFVKKVRHALVDNLEDISYIGFMKFDAGKLQNTLIAEVQKLFHSMNFYFNSIQQGVMLVTFIALAFYSNLQFAFWVTIGVGIFGFIYRRIYKATKALSIEVSLKGDDFNSYLLQAVHNFKYLKATHYFAKYAQKLRTVINKTEQLTLKMGNYQAILDSIREPLVILIVSGVILIQVNWLNNDFSSILLTLLLFYRALSYLMNFQSSWQLFVQTVGGMTVVADLFEKLQLEKEQNSGRQIPNSFNMITLKDMDFWYGEKKVLDHINLSIARNTSVAFVGESGSGKTTLVNVIATLLQPHSGEFLLDDRSIEQFDKTQYRLKIGYISQDPVIFNDSIFNNITFWDEPSEENLQRFWEVIELASLTSFIQNMDNNINSILGDHGVRISGGQKQRISIARELYKKVDILILDEATSALDSETEKVIKENIDNLKGLYTVLIIAHRLSTIKNVDKVYLLDKGKIVGDGKFNELLIESDKFKRMVALQELS